MSFLRIFIESPSKVSDSLALKEILFDIIWIVLYPVMYGIVIAFVCVSLYTLTNKKHLTDKEFKIFLLITLVMNIISTIIGFVTVDEIRSFVVYAAITCLPCFFYHVYHAFKTKRKASIILTAVLFPQIFGFYFQITKTGTFTLFNIPFNHDAIYHLCLLVSVVMFYYAAVADLNEKKVLSVD